MNHADRASRYIARRNVKDGILAVGPWIGGFEGILENRVVLRLAESGTLATHIEIIKEKGGTFFADGHYFPVEEYDDATKPPSPDAPAKAWEEALEDFTKRVLRSKW